MVLPVPGGPGHQDAVVASGRDLQRAFGLSLALHVGHIRITRRFTDRRGRPGLQQLGAGQMCADLQQTAGGVHLRIAYQRRFGRVGFREHERATAAMCAERHRERAANRAQFAGQRELAGKLILRQCIQWQLAGRTQDAERDRQVEAAALLGQVGGSEIHGDALCGKFESRCLQRSAHAVLRFLDLGLRQADDREARQTIGEMCLHRDRRGVHARDGAAVQDCNRHEVQR
jgi:hypothetical protein